MKYFAAILFLQIFAVAVLAQQTEISRYNSESEADRDLQREQWINQMHRAAPGTDPRAMDIAAASGPAAVYYSDDGGATWLSSSGLGGPKNWGGFKRGVITADEQTMYVFGNEWDYSKSRGVSTLYRSTDEGKSFKNIRTWDY